MFVYVNMKQRWDDAMDSARFCRCECPLLTSAKADGIPEGS